MTVRPLAAAVLVTAFSSLAAGCASLNDYDPGWTRTERVALGAGKDFEACARAAVAQVPGLTAVDLASTVDDGGRYLALSGPPIDNLGTMIGAIHHVAPTIELEFTTKAGQYPADAQRAATERLIQVLLKGLSARCA